MERNSPSVELTISSTNKTFHMAPTISFGSKMKTTYSTNETKE
jgi:hypothetical protein